MTVTPIEDKATWVRSAVDRFEGSLLLYAAKFVGDPEKAGDVVQDTFVKLCEQDRLTIEPRLAEWLFTVCRNRALDVLRKEKRMSQLGDAHARGRHDTGAGPDEKAECRDSAAKVLKHLDALPASQREVILLRFQDGFSYQEIARISGHSSGNVGYLLHVGLKSIREKFAEVPPARAHQA